MDRQKRRKDAGEEEQAVVRSTVSMKPPKLPDASDQEPLTSAIRRAKEEEDVRGRLFIGDELENTALVGADFYGCTFSECRLSGWQLEEVHFSDCLFQGCDLSGLRLEGGGFHRVEFRGCRLMGVSFSGTLFDSVFLLNCGASYGNFAECQFRSCLLQRSDFSEGSFGGSQFQKSAVEECRFRLTEFFHAGIEGLDFSSSSLEGAVFAIPDVKGITVSAEQAVELSKLLGLRVK
ncbi:MAG: pentapeptide repeat-containing protein [Hydrogeniiclostridium sp.]